MPEKTRGALVLKGRPVADQIRADVRGRVGQLRARGVVPTLHLIRVGDRDDDVRYQAGLVRQSGKVGIAVTTRELPADTGQAALEDALTSANEDAGVHGIMVFQPLPGHLDARRVNALINPVKDVDGLSPANQVLVYQGSPAGVPPCTPAAVVAMLKHYDVPLKGATVAVVGRSMVVGKPAAMLLLDEHATVTVCHSRTVDLPRVTAAADIVVAAIGKRGFLGAGYFGPGQTVIDVGTHVDESGSLVGDVDADAVAPVVARLAPARGGVGSVTSAILFKHVVTAAERLTAEE